MKFTIFFIISFLASFSSASIQAGVGLNSQMSGRYVPGATISYDSGTWAISAMSIGVQTAAYYQSSYTLGYYRTWELGEFLWGDLDGGFGGGVGYTQRGFRDSTGTEKRDEMMVGPGFRVNWEVVSPVVFGFEAIYGLGNTIGPLFHDWVMFSLGCKF